MLLASEGACEVVLLEVELAGLPDDKGEGEVVLEIELAGLPDDKGGGVADTDAGVGCGMFVSEINKIY